MIKHKKKKFQFQTETSHFSDVNHVAVDEVSVPQVHEPLPDCQICGKPIEAIIEAIRESDGSYSHFDCVLEKIKKEYHVDEPDKVSYIGRGTFAVVSKDSDGNIVFKDRIQYESGETFNSAKQYVEENRK
ncbi:MAG: hypothetical protein MJ052_04605 [Sphaerochaetaceae bacterium]|nr:hypothetical protein [Sphaerochaetaceae bacterium]